VSCCWRRPVLGSPTTPLPVPPIHFVNANLFVPFVQAQKSATLSSQESCAAALGPPQVAFVGLLYFFLFGCLPHIPPHPPAPPSPLFARSVPLALLLFTSNCFFLCVFLARQPRFLHCLWCFVGASTCNRCPRTPPIFLHHLFYFPTLVLSGSQDCA
jgi:hypothetical protein